MVLTSSFSLQAEIHPEYNHASTIYNWISDKTGLQVILIQHETPIINGYFAVASEVSNDSGTPHTLEHLVFMGSKNYPYKGLLDTVGNKMFSSTNAWTGTDQTVYTLVTAGWEGFRDLLPVYLDHVLYPILTDSACLTEVYHIDGNGEEKGVVFSEMQGIENTSSSLIAGQAQKLMFRDDSGYSSNTGGLMDALRILNNKDIRDFHKLRYTPDNLCIIVTGPVKPEELMEVMSKFDNDLDYVKDPNFKRPFVDSKRDENLEKNIIDEVEFPEADEDFGEVQISWKGPSSLNLIENTALDIVGSYLTTEGSGKLQLELVDVNDPLATDISYYTDDYIDTVYHLYLSGVPTERLGEVESEVIRVIESQIEKLDLTFINDCRERKMNKFILSAEKDPSTLAYISIDNFLYGAKDGKNLIEWTKDVSEFENLSKWPLKDWQDFIKKWFIDNSRIIIKGKPSTVLFERLNNEKEQRINNYKKKFGEDGLKKLAERIEKAQNENNQPIPNEILDSFIAPNPENIRFIHTVSADSGLAYDEGTSVDSSFQQLIKSTTPKDFPLYLHFENFESKFVAIRIYFSSFPVDEHLLPYIQVLFSELFSLPMILPDGTKLSYEEVVKEIKKDTLENSISCSGQFEEFVSLKLQGKVENYSKCIEWIIRSLYYTIFDKDRIQVLIEKHLNGLSEEKRDGSNVVASSILKTTLTTRSLKRASDTLITEEFYENLLDLIDDGKFNKIKDDLEKLRFQLFKLNNMRVLVMGGIDNIIDPVKSWVPLIDICNEKNKSPQLNVVPIPRSIACRSRKGMSLDKQAIITPMSATESSYLALLSKGPIEYNDEDIPSLAVCCSYLQAVEGPLWRGVRGTGLAYGASLFRSIEQGQIVLDIYRGTDAGKAVSVTKQIVEDLASNKSEFENSSIEGAICSIVNTIASNESDFYTAASSKFFDNYIKMRGPNFNEKFMESIKQVKKEDLKRVLKKYILPMFDIKTSIIFVACNVSMVESLESQFKKEGYEVIVNQVVGVDDDDDDDDDEGDDDDDDDDDDEDEEEVE